MSIGSQQMVEVLRAAGESTRLRILALLVREELAVMELSQVLEQSQPRVSRHLKLLTAAGLVERFPDGAWVFYRLSGGARQRAFVDQIVSSIAADDPGLERDVERLQAVRAERNSAAAAYFARNAARWDEVRSLYVDEAEVEAAILRAAGPGPYRRIVDLGTGAGRMLALLGPKAETALGLDLSQQMLNVARVQTGEAGLGRCELRHGDIFDTGLPEGSADLVVIHRVLHYLADPAAAVSEAARIVSSGGKLLIVDFAPHDLEHLRQAHQHRRLGFSDEEIGRWLAAAGLDARPPAALPPVSACGLTVKVWSAERAALALQERSAA